MFNKKELIENTVKVNIYYQKHRKRTEIDMIRKQKWNMILEILWLVQHSPEIDWKIEEVKITRYLEEYGKQQRPKQGKSDWQKQKKEEKKEKSGKKQQREKKRYKDKKNMKRIKIEVKK